MSIGNFILCTNSTKYINNFLKNIHKYHLYFPRHSQLIHDKKQHVQFQSSKSQQEKLSHSIIIFSIILILIRKSHIFWNVIFLQDGVLYRQFRDMDVIGIKIQYVSVIIVFTEYKNYEYYIFKKIRYISLQSSNYNCWNFGEMHVSVFFFYI